MDGCYKQAMLCKWPVDLHLSVLADQLSPSLAICIVFIFFIENDIRTTLLYDAICPTSLWLTP
uniref:Uncharacterized protein n=1 Tax=Arundo donax TaxID=35708 RepID=A0A0A9FP64_ARUDO